MSSGSRLTECFSVEIYWDSEWASEASGITSSSEVGSLKRVNNLYCLVDKREIEGKKRRKTKRGGKGNVVLRGDGG